MGDLMLDEYVMGAVDRVSPEAPVPVVRVRDTEHRLGGAANVARQVAALGAKVILGGVIGQDAAGDDLLRLCAVSRIDTRGVVRAFERRTTRKLRVVGHSQQLLRMDWEDVSPCDGELCRRMLDELPAEGPDAVILSDYAKGVLTAQLIGAIADRAGAVPVVVDPKSRDFTRYRGATIVTPNLRELELATGASLDPTDSAAVAAAAQPLIAAAGLASMVVTLSEHGMLAVPASGPTVSVPASRRAVFDVTGAGDTAIAGTDSVACRQGLLGRCRATRQCRRGRLRRSGRRGRRRCRQHPHRADHRARCQGARARGARRARGILAHRGQAHRLHEWLL
ncbi:MAG: PfkB family carbohydrate kinase [Steroidobacteraceae bacterium]